MSGLTNSERAARKEADRKFREALTEWPAFRPGSTVLTEEGGVEVVQEYTTSQGIALVHKVRIVADGISMHAYTGLRVIPVDDDSNAQSPKEMDVSGEVEFPIHVHSVRFSEPNT